MNFTQLQSYLKAYLETNDSAVIDQIPNFMTLALTRISAELRGVVAETSVDLLPEQTQPQPAGFMGAVLLLQDGMISTYVSPADFAGLTNEPGAYYTLLAGQISTYPEPGENTLLTLTYYQATGDNMSANLPHLLLHCAAAEAELFQGNLQDAAQEIQLYLQDMNSANGWDIQSGPIRLGGGISVAAGTASGTNTPGAGYVKGPSSSTDSYIPQWSGSTGRLLTNGLPVSTFAEAASLGTAANADLTTTTTDTTAGRVTKVGDFGLGTLGSIPSVGNIDAMKATGFYKYAAGVDSGTLPVGTTNGIVQCVTFTTAISRQTFYAVNGNNDVTGIYTRQIRGTTTIGAWVEVATSANSIGQSQTWQNLTASRALNTIYTNTTGRPIQVKVACAVTAAASMQLFIAGDAASLPGAQSSSLPENSAIVPNGTTYRALNSAGTASALNWWELR